MDVLQVLAISLHTLSLVVALGYYGLLGRVMLPALERSLDGPQLAAALASIERRAFPLVVLSAAAFTLTGTYLLVMSPQYEGPGNVFASAWTTLMLVKHALIVGIVALALLVHRRLRRIGASGPTSHAAADDPGVRGPALPAEALTALGALVIVLTASAQVLR
jgi:putative copper export protein